MRTVADKMRIENKKKQEKTRYEILHKTAIKREQQA